MDQNQRKHGGKTTSVYAQLHTAIDNMVGHGKSVGDDRVVALATRLREDLVRFENNVDHQSIQVKHEFKDAFLKTLHSNDQQFPPETKRFIQAMHKGLYLTVFSNKKHFLQFSLFEKSDTENNGSSRSSIYPPQ